MAILFENLHTVNTPRVLVHIFEIKEQWIFLGSKFHHENFRNSLFHSLIALFFTY